MNFIFWNTSNNRINLSIEQLVVEQASDIIVLCEYNDDLNGLCDSISKSGRSYYSNINIGGCRVKILLGFKPEITHYSEVEYYTIKNIKLGDNNILLAGVHFPSKLFSEDEDLLPIVQELIKDIEKAEVSEKHVNTIIVGDLNANPFDGSVINACSMHGIPTRNDAIKSIRTVKGREYKMFYNPMWNLFGELAGSPGTYYYNASKQRNYYWNMFDQVLIRPTLIDYFDLDKLKIITSINGNSIMKNNIPNKEFSDHLPIVFSINFC